MRQILHPYTILQRYEELHPKSKELYTKAVEVFPSGITHDMRRLLPFGVYMEQAQGAHKWDVDGNRYIDYVVGHGALLLGHGRPEVVQAVRAQVAQGTHLGAPHALEVEWGQWVKKLVPSAEMVKFFSSGTEATLMAIRLARTFTGKSKLLKFQHHFHGWHDYVMGAPHAADEPTHSPGIPDATLSTVVMIPDNDPDLLDTTLASNLDIAAVILEPTGAHWGTFPLVLPDFLRAVQEIARQRKVLFVLDEVITGFRLAPGGAQEYYDLKPDLTTMAKIVAGGLPGGAVAGRRDIMSHLGYRDDPAWNAQKRLSHPGTYNANPLSAAAAVAVLKIVATGEPQRYVNALGKKLRDGLNQVFRQKEAPGFVYGNASMFHFLLGIGCTDWEDPDRCAMKLEPEVLERGGNPQAALALKHGLLNEGVDLMRMGGMLSNAHSEDDVEHTIKALDATLDAMRQEGLV